WFWYIPLHDDLVSVGAVGDFEKLFTPGATHEEIFHRQLSRCPGIERRLAPGTRANDYFATKDFSYTARQFAGDGWVLVGDAFGFIDPVYSSGVFLALKGGEFAADAIHDALERNDVSGPRLGQWQPLYRQGLENFRRLVYAFYAEDFSFGMFLKDNPQYKSNMVDILVGDVFKPGVDEIFEAMGTLLPPPDEPIPEANPVA
ncbi:MAG: tryptophan 7-halogenase, partial [Planctomycetaceae bacterium]|nr:tryptophan 7-halogenase [Planctomycetaceae bacterium]